MPPLWIQVNASISYWAHSTKSSIILGILKLVFVQIGLNTRHWKVPNQYKKQYHQIFIREYRCLILCQIVLLNNYRKHFKSEHFKASRGPPSPTILPQHEYEVGEVYLMACSLWALRTSGFWFLLAMISAREAPVIALWNFTARRVRFFVTSSCLIKRFIR